MKARDVSQTFAFVNDHGAVESVVAVEPGVRVVPEGAPRVGTELVRPRGARVDMALGDLKQGTKGRHVRLIRESTTYSIPNKPYENVSYNDIHDME